MTPAEMFKDAEQTFEFQYDRLHLSFMEQVLVAMEEKGITVQELGAHLGITPNIWSAWCGGNRPVSLSHALQIARFLKMKLNFSLEP